MWEVQDRGKKESHWTDRNGEILFLLPPRPRSYYTEILYWERFSCFLHRPDSLKCWSSFFSVAWRISSDGALKSNQAGVKYRNRFCAFVGGLTLRLLMSYIYGAPSKARNANVVYIWTYVWQRWNSLFIFVAQFFNTESMQRGFLCHICV